MPRRVVQRGPTPEPIATVDLDDTENETDEEARSTDGGGGGGGGEVDTESGELSTDQEEAKRKTRSRKSKKTKKKKKHKKKHKSRSRHRSSSLSEREEEEDGSRRHREEGEASESDNDEKAVDGLTDAEDGGGSTPELPEIDREVVLEKEPEKVEPDGRRRHDRRHERAPRRGDRDEDKRRRERRSVSREDRKRPSRRDNQNDEPPPAKREKKEADDQQGSSSGQVISLSVEETNKLRASLGLAPLKTNDADSNGVPEDESAEAKAKREVDEEKKREMEAKAEKFGGTLIPNSSNNEILIPATNLTETAKAEKIREKIKQRRQKREQESKLLTLKKLGDSDSDDESGQKWVEKQKRLAKEKAAAAKRAKALEELEDEFGVGSLVEEETSKDRQLEYGRRDLRGLKVEHAADKFKEGQSVILTLKDADVLDEEAKDTLMNVNIADDERTTKKLHDARKARAGYNAYDMEEIDELTGEIRRKNLLNQYDEELFGHEKESFKIGKDGDYNEEEAKEKERRKVRAKLQLNARKLESLAPAQLKIASDYLTKEEADVKFKKPKKKKKVKKKMFKASDLEPLAEESFGSRSKKTKSPKKKEVEAKDEQVKEEQEEEQNERQFRQRGALPMDIDDDDMPDTKPDVEDIKLENEEEDDMGLSVALERARKLQQKRKKTETAEDIAERLLKEVKEEPKVKDEEEVTGSEFISTFEDENAKTLILNETVEFCRNLGSRQMSRAIDMKKSHKSRDNDEKSSNVQDELLDFEESLKSSATKQYEERRRGKWATLDEDQKIVSDSDDDIMEIEVEKHYSLKRKGRDAILEEEPDLGVSVAAAIKLADSKGYWEKEEKKSSGSSLKHLQAKNYAIDDKMQSRDDERDRRRHGGGGGASASHGPTVPFAEKKDWKPNVKLDYIDDEGRKLNTKEAFRFLSHKFHGKGSGKMKTEKRMKKLMEEGLMKNMSSIDTPLNTLDKLRKRQEEGAVPYVVLTGSKAVGNQDLKKF